MKFKLLLILCFSVMYSQSYCQQFYLSLHAGYGIGLAPNEYTSFESIRNGEELSGSEESENFSFGEGTSFGGSIGYFITSNIGLDLTAEYQISSDLLLDFYYSDSDGTQDGTQKISARTLYIAPSLFVYTQIGAFKPYFKMGPVFGFPNLTEEQKSLVTPIMQVSASYPYETDIAYEGGSAVGINSTLGLAYNISGNFNLNLQVNNKNISYTPKRGKRLNAVYNGQHVYSSFTRSQNEVEFVDKINYTQDPNSPRQVLKLEYPLSSLSFSLGISYLL